MTSAEGSGDQLAARSPEQLLELAAEAGRIGDAPEYLRLLFLSNYTDGVRTRLVRNWSGRVPPEDIDDCIAAAIDGAYQALSNGRSINSLAGWIWKVAMHKTYDRWTRDLSRRRELPVDIPDRRQGNEEEEKLPTREDVVRIARGLLPRIGQGQIVDVMTVLIDAVERGVEDLPAETIGETLGLSAAAVRSLLHRGLERLEREARAAGVLVTEVTEAGGTAIDQEDEEDENEGEDIQ